MPKTQTLGMIRFNWIGLWIKRRRPSAEMGAGQG